MADRFGSWSPWPAPPVSSGYTYPVLPRGMVPGSNPRLNRRRFSFFGGGTLAVLVIVITLIAVLARVIPNRCVRGCGPATGNQVTASVYANQKWDYSIPYDGNEFSIGQQDANGVSFNAAGGDGTISFAATPGTNVNGANQAALNALPSNTFQNLQQVGPVRGAEIGLVGGQGTAFSGDYVDPDSGASPIGLVVFSASHNGVTLTVTAFSAASNSNDDAPYGLSLGKKMDFPVTHTIWNGP